MKKMQGKAPSLLPLVPMAITTCWPLLVAVVTMVFMLLGCPSTPVSPTPDADASAVDGGHYDCASWCANATSMMCASAVPSEHGATCLDVCTNVQSGPAPFDLACRSTATSCAMADGCENNEQSKLLDRVVMDSGMKALPAPTCAEWCKHASVLHCAAALPTPKGSSCIEVCRNVQTGPLRWNLVCKIQATSCVLADKCQ